MSKRSVFVSTFVFSIAILVASPSFAKVPYRKDHEKRETPAAMVDQPTRSVSIGRSGRVNTVTKAKPGKVCTHTHRYSGQHVM